MTHPSERIAGATSKHLAGKHVVLAVTGSIAAVRVVEIARELLRHGARVTPVMTRAACEILHPNALEFATGVAPVTKLTGQVEHVRDKECDLLLVAPATGNTISKMALGIDDTPVTTYFTALPDKSKCLVAPAMHESMWTSPFLEENLQRLSRAGVTILPPFFEEGKAKLPEPDVIVAHALRALSPGTLRGKRLLVINGSTVEPLDEMRVVTNKSTGRMGVALVEEAFRLGAHVEHWFGHGHVAHHESPAHVATKRFVTVADLLAMVEGTDLSRFDAVLMPAAISDYGPAASSGKIPSEGGDLTLRLSPLPKVVKALRERYHGALVAFKAESGIAEKALVEKARRSIAANRAAFVVANDLRSVGVDDTSVLLVDERDVRSVRGTKHEVAVAVLEKLARALPAQDAARPPGGPKLP